jgi:hypothetical protein
MTTTQSQPTTRTVEMTLRMPPDMAKAVTNSARALSMSKSDFVRKSLKRNLDYVLKNELPLIETNSRLKEALAVELTGGR